jgi:prepilin-type N-terminal cleavage/methylation domain-containing protein
MYTRRWNPTRQLGPSRPAGRRGFTMVELMIVFFILGLLTAITLPQFRFAVEKTDLAGCQQNLRSLASGAVLYANDDSGGTYPTTLMKLTPNYLFSIPTCPAARRDTYTASYSSASGANCCFTVACGPGRNHANPTLNMQANQPYWMSGYGLAP